MRRLLPRIIVSILALAAAVYLVDYAIWHIRLARGTAMSSIPIDTYLATPLKANKAEYDYLGTQPEPCANALFSHGGAPACWWLAKHTSQWE